MNTGGYLNNNNANNAYRGQPDCANHETAENDPHTVRKPAAESTQGAESLPEGEQYAADAIGTRPGIAENGRTE